MMLIKKNLLLMFLLCIAFAVHAQERTVTGTITADGKPVAGVNVLVKGAKTGTVTNADGNFSIKVSQSNAVLIFSSVGYISQEVVLKKQSAVDVVLVADNKALDDVVVIGYGTQRKRDLTGAVSSVKARDLVISSGPEIGNMLKGKVAGLTITQNSAQPGGGLNILIRGAASVGNLTGAGNDPLFVVDGFPISDLQQPASGGRYQGGTQSILNSFNPNDIESIEVLKDASATS
ncbi:carboxypeptidase-like regulatory domain-containing protein, partial [Ferruginibacter sp.]